MRDCSAFLYRQGVLCHLGVQPFEEFVFRDHDALAELDLGEAGGVDEFVGVCPGDARNCATWVMRKGTES